MHHLLRRKIIVLVVSFVFCSTASVAQLRDAINQDGHDDKPYHFGINLGYNKSHFKSNEALREAMGYILGMGFAFKAKPEAFASSSCANKIVN